MATNVEGLIISLMYSEQIDQKRGICCLKGTFQRSAFSPFRVLFVRFRMQAHNRVHVRMHARDEYALTNAR
jgi:hypothetical protein